MLNVLALLAIQVHAFSFGGGTASEFAAKLQSHSLRPVVVLVSIEGGIDRISVSTEKIDDLYPKVLEIAHYAGIMKPAFGIAPKAWPVDLFVRGYGRMGVGLNAPVDWVVPDGLEKMGRLTLRTKDNEIGTLGDVRRILAPKAVQSHWFFEKAQIAFAVKNCSRDDFALACAGALGAKLSIDDKGYLFDLDPKIFRERAVAIKSNPGPTMRNVCPPARAEIIALAFQSMADKQIIDAWRTPESSLSLRLDSTEMRSAVKRYLETMLSNANPYLSEVAKKSLNRPYTIEVGGAGFFVCVIQEDGVRMMF